MNFIGQVALQLMLLFFPPLIEMHHVFALQKGPVRVSRTQLVLYCLLLSLIICKCTEEFLHIFTHSCTASLECAKNAIA